MTTTPLWSRTSRYFVLGIAILALAALLASIRTLLGPLALAALIAYLLNPLVGLLIARTRLSRAAAANLTYFAFLTLLIVAAVLISPAIADQARAFSDNLQSLLREIDEPLSRPVRFLGFELSLDGLQDEIRQTSEGLLGSDRVFRILRAATENLIWVLVILVASYYMLVDWLQLRTWMIGLVPIAQQEDVDRLLEELKAIWNSYLRGQLALMALVGIMSGLAGAAVGLPRAALLGLLAGGLDLIPSLGPTVATALAAMTAWGEGSSILPISHLWFSVLVVAMYAVVQLVEAVWLQPRLLAHRVRLHRGIVFLAIVGALTLGSALLALVIIPALASFGLIGRYLHSRVLGYSPWPERLSPAD